MHGGYDREEELKLAERMLEIMPAAKPCPQLTLLEMKALEGNDSGHAGRHSLLAETDVNDQRCPG